MKHLPEQDRTAADIVLGPVVHLNGSTEASKTPEWMLPCHSIMLSSRSPVFAASTTHAQSTGCEKTADGKRIFRLPLHKRCAVRLLQFCYGTLEDPKQLSLLEAVQLAVISDMHDLKGQATGIACHEDGLCTLEVGGASIKHRAFQKLSLCCLDLCESCILLTMQHQHQQHHVLDAAYLYSAV